MKKAFPVEAKVGIFILIVSIILLYSTFKLSHYTEKKRGYTVYAYFKNVAGVYEATPVHLEGVKIGVVESLSIENGRILVKMRIRDDIRIAKGTVARIKTKGLLGSAYIELTHGTPEKGYLKDGDFIEKTESPVEFTEIARELQEIAQDIKSITHSIKKAIGEEDGKENLSEIIENLNSILSDIKEISGTGKEDIRLFISNLKKLSESLKKDEQRIKRIAEQVENIVAENRQDFKNTIKKAKEIAEKLDKLIDSARNIIKDVEEGRGTVGKLLKDEKTAKKLESVISSLDETLSATRKWKTIMKYRGEVWVDGKASKHFFGIRLQPSHSKYYELNIESVPEWIEEDTQVRGNDIKFSLYLALKWKILTLRGGVIESTGGLGIDLDLFKDYITFTVECYDFFRKTNPAVRAYLDFLLYKYIFVSTGADYLFDRISSNRRIFVGFGIRFTDEDLKRILGLAATSAVVGSGF